MSPDVEPSIERGGTTRKCANCGQVGHIKTNKKYVSPYFILSSNLPRLAIAMFSCLCVLILLSFGGPVSCLLCLIFCHIPGQVSGILFVFVSF